MSPREFPVQITNIFCGTPSDSNMFGTKCCIYIRTSVRKGDDLRETGSCVYPHGAGQLYSVLHALIPVWLIQSPLRGTVLSIVRGLRGTVPRYLQKFPVQKFPRFFRTKYFYYIVPVKFSKTQIPYRTAPLFRVPYRVPYRYQSCKLSEPKRIECNVLWGVACSDWIIR